MTHFSYHAQYSTHESSLILLNTSSNSS